MKNANFFSGFNKRIGSDTTTSLGGRPRSLEQKDDDDNSEDDDEKESRSIDVKNVREDNVRNAVDASEGKDEIVNRRRRRHLVDGNGNRILHVVKRDATEMAEVETTEKVIQVRRTSFLICISSLSIQLYSFLINCPYITIQQPMSYFPSTPKRRCKDIHY